MQARQSPLPNTTPTYIYGAFVVVLILRLLLIDWGFFWDNVFLISQQAHYFYESGFSSWILPDNFDSGHPTLVPMYVAAWWSLFGKSLVVAQLSFIPILIIHFYGVLKLFQLIDNKVAVGCGITLLLCDPVYLTMVTTMSTEIFLLTGFVFALYGYMDKKYLPLILGLVCMGFVSKRGDMSILPFAAVACYDFIKKKNRLIIPVFIGGFISLLFHLYHYYAVGWMLTNPRGTWDSVNTMGSPMEWLHSMAGLVVRLGEFGRFAPWLLFLLFIKRIPWRRPQNKTLASIAGVWVVIFILVLIPFHLAFGPRYFLPLFICLYFLLGQLIADFSPERRKVVMIALTVLLIAGHAWKYPMNFAQPWGATYRHAPMHDMMKSFHEHRLTAPWKDEMIGTGFPYIRPTAYAFVQDEYKNCKAFNLEEDDYILYFTTTNDFDSEDVSTLATWDTVYIDQRMGIDVILFHRPPDLIND